MDSSQGGHRAHPMAAFMAGPLGRGLRGAMGIALMLIGLKIGGWPGLIVAAVGVVPLAAGAFNFCLIAPLLHAPFWGRDARG